jgi:hypothetical protein
MFQLILRCGSSSGDIGYVQPGVTLGHPDIGVTEKLRQLVGVATVHPVQDAKM